MLHLNQKTVYRVKKGKNRIAEMEYKKGICIGPENTEAPGASLEEF